MTEKTFSTKSGTIHYWVNILDAKISGHGFKMLACAIEKDLPYEIKCPALLICGTKDKAGSCIRYSKAGTKTPTSHLNG